MYKLKKITIDDQNSQTVLANLVKMYCYEWSQYTGMDVNKQGEYIFEQYISNYWEREDQKAFLLSHIDANGESHWAGFALIDRDFCIHKDYDYSMGEFFVMHKYRKKGAGRWMANTLFSKFPGKWELGRNPKNKSAYNFWEQVICDYTNGKYELICSTPAHEYADGTLGDIFSFCS